MVDKSKVTNIVFADIEDYDFPDYVNAYITSADYKGNPMSDKDIEILNYDSEFVHEKLMEYLS